MGNAKEITLANIVATKVELIGNHIKTDIDFGAITLTNGKKEFILDVVQSYRNYDKDENITTIDLDLEIDKELFKDQCKFNLTDLDLLLVDTKGEIYFAMDDMKSINSIKMYLKVKCTSKTLNLSTENE